MMVADPAVQEALLQHPEVQAAVKEAGEKALADPAVQAKIVATAKEQFPHAAEDVAAQVSKWAEDPDVQGKALHYAGTLMSNTVTQVGDTKVKILALIEQGPTGIRALGFAGGVVSTTLSILGLFSHVFTLGPIFTPIEFGLCFYQACFGVSVALFEMPPWVIEMYPAADRWQELLVENCKFLTHTRGRGFFYGFLSAVWLFESTCPPDLISFLVGCYLGFLGIIHLLLSMGWTGVQIASKIRSEERQLLQALNKAANGSEAREVELAERKSNTGEPLLSA